MMKINQYDYINNRSSKGRTALMNVCERSIDDKNYKLVLLLLENFADPFIKDIDGNSCYDLAMAKGNYRICKLIEYYWNNVYGGIPTNVKILSDKYEEKLKI